MKKPGRPGSGGPTLRAISLRSGHGLMTVSRALGPEAHRVAEVKRLEIQRIAAEMGYRPNLNVQALRRGSGNLVGLLCERLDGRTHEILIGLHDGLLSHGLLPFLLMTEHQPPRDGKTPGESAILHLIERRIAAIVAVANDPLRPPTWLSRLPEETRERGIPTVAIAATPEDHDLPMIRADLTWAAQQMVDYVLARGPRQMAIIGTPEDDPWHDAICAALAAECTRRGLTCQIKPDPAWRPDPNTGVCATNEAARTRLLGHPGSPLAWIAGADAPYLPFPGLAVDLNYRALGAAAADHLVGRLAGATDLQPMDLPGRINIQE